MTAKLRPAGALKKYIDDREEVEIESGRTIRQVLSELGIPAEIVALVVVNEEQKSKDYTLEDNDVVRILAVIGGG